MRIAGLNGEFDAFGVLMGQEIPALVPEKRRVLQQYITQQVERLGFALPFTADGTWTSLHLSQDVRGLLQMLDRMTFAITPMGVQVVDFEYD